MQSHPDADAFMRNYLEQPADATTRLVFADWLEETCEPHNAAWAHFIRLKIETDRHDPGSRARRELDRQADTFARDIHARLTISANRFVRDAVALIHLLPPANILVRLADFEVPRTVVELMPESIARENVLMVLAVQGLTLLIAALNPRDTDLLQKLQFILNHDIILVGGERDDIVAAIDRNHGISETESVDSVLVEFTDPPSRFHRAETDEERDNDDADAPVARLVNLILMEAVNMRADRVLLYPDPDALSVRFRIGGEWIERDQCPRRLVRPVMRRLAIMAGIYPGELFNGVVSEIPIDAVVSVGMPSGAFRVGIHLEFPPDGPLAQLEISEATA